MQGPAGRRRRRGALVTACAVTALALAGCGSSGGNASTPTATTQPTSGPATTAAVTHAYAVLFDLANPALAPKLAVVQDGASLSATMAAELKTTLAKTAAGATVASVTVEPPSTCAQSDLPTPCASVRYTVVGTNHKPLLSNSAGYAVYIGGSWLVAKETICGLLSLASGGGEAPAGC